MTIRSTVNATELTSTKEITSETKELCFGNLGVGDPTDTTREYSEENLPAEYVGSPVPSDKHYTG